MRTKYQFRSRREAEDAYHNEEVKRRQAEWLASALIQGRTHFVGKVDHTCVAYFATRHYMYVYTYQRGDRGPHCLGQIYELDDVPNRVEQLQGRCQQRTMISLRSSIQSFEQQLAALLQKAYNLADAEFSLQLSNPNPV